MSTDLNLNTQHKVLDELNVIHPIEPEATILLMLDIETLALGPRPVVTQAALLGYDLDEDEHMEAQHAHYYPVEPQLQIIPPRRVSASTIAWWMKQSDEARERFELSTSDDFQDLVALGRNIITVFNQLTMNGTRNYVLAAKGPQFDVVAMETLLEELGLEVPWSYDRVFDLRTYLRVAGVNAKNVMKPAGCIPHVAYWDARWQILQFLEAKKTLSGR